MKKDEERWTVFWCNLLSPVLYGEVARGDINKFLKNLCQEYILFPNGKYELPSLSTLRRKVNKYESKGFEALKRQRRSDIGINRNASSELILRAIQLKIDNPKRSADTINYVLLQEFGQKVPQSTLYRSLKKAGATKLKLGFGEKKVRKRWTKKYPNDMWIGDVEYGPRVICGDEKTRKTYMSAFIDVHSRYIVSARYYYRQDMDVLVDSLLNGWILNGLPKAIYLDNAKIYHSNQLKTACYKLGVNLIYRKPGDPAPGGLIERFFKTLQDQFESEIKASDILTLDELNRGFSAWLDIRYHNKVHSETKMTPKEMYNNTCIVKRQVNMQKAQGSFLLKTERTVNKDFSDIVLFKKFYRVNEKLRGDKLKVYYNPIFSIDKIVIHDLNDSYLGEGVLHTRDKCGKVQIKSPTKSKYNINKIMIEEHNKKLKQQSPISIDYCKIAEKRPWPFSAFVQKFSDLSGRKGGYSSFTTDEHEKLDKAYYINKDINENIVKQAFENAQSNDFEIVILNLRKLLRNKEK